MRLIGLPISVGFHEVRVIAVKLIARKIAAKNCPHTLLLAVSRQLSPRNPPCPGGQVGVGVGPTLDLDRTIYQDFCLSRRTAGCFIEDLARPHSPPRQLKKFPLYLVETHRNRHQQEPHYTSRMSLFVAPASGKLAIHERKSLKSDGQAFTVAVRSRKANMGNG